MTPHDTIAARGLAALAFVGCALVSSAAAARPTAPHLLCETYPDAARCAGALATCNTCHTSTWPPSWNEYGVAVAGALSAPFEEGLPGALRALDGEDSDGDGVANGDELRVGTGPGDPEDSWPACTLGAEAHAERLPIAADYDLERALRRVSLLYCGVSPSYARIRDFAALPSDAARYAALHDDLDDCLSGATWRDQGVQRLADWRIRPVRPVGKDSPLGIVIGDYEWDYRLFAYVMTGDRDVRDLLLAQYHVDRDANGALVKVEGIISGDPGQPAVPERRAGMITTQWFFAINTMFSPLPRTTAAQAYRAYLGADIAKQEGIFPIEGEPRDIDQKGVQSAECASCHSTLDPLSYAFASYNGLGGGNTGAFAPFRPANTIEEWDDPATYLFGDEVDGVTGWAARAAESDAFKRTVVVMLFRHAMDRDPLPDEQAAFAEIWRSLPEAGWSANAIIHRLVDFYGFGAR